MNKLQIFKNPEFGQVRTLIKDGQPYFVGKDIAEILEYTDAEAMCRRVDDEDQSIATSQNLQNVGFEIPSRGLKIINESGLYAAILGSQKLTAKKFKHWVTSEVLPAIRKTGGYVANEDLFIETYLPYADENTKLVFKNTLSMVRKQNEIIAIQKSTIDKQDKDLEHKQGVIVGLVDEISLAEKRQVLNRVVRYKGANFQERWRELYKQFSMKYHIDLDYQLNKYNESHKPKLKNKIDYIDRVMNKIPELYEIACKLYENDVKELAKNLYSLNEEAV